MTKHLFGSGLARRGPGSLPEESDFGGGSRRSSGFPPGSTLPAGWLAFA